MGNNTQTCDSIVDALRWRYATKKFDPSKKIAPEIWQKLQSALVLSPSSYGMQPYKFVVVTDQKVKEELVSATRGQTQPRDCSHLVVFSRLAKVDAAHVEHYVKRLVEVRNVAEDTVAGLKNILLDFVTNTPEERLANWSARQCYIALGNLMTVASALQVDNGPMEGFVAEEYDRILQLPEKGLRSVVLCALGYRAPDDKYAQLAKVRLPESELIVKI